MAWPNTGRFSGRDTSWSGEVLLMNLIAQMLTEQVQSHRLCPHTSSQPAETAQQLKKAPGGAVSRQASPCQDLIFPPSSSRVVYTLGLCKAGTRENSCLTPGVETVIGQSSKLLQNQVPQKVFQVPGGPRITSSSPHPGPCLSNCTQTRSSLFCDFGLSSNVACH